jgi:hypothetical protein
MRTIFGSRGKVAVKANAANGDVAQDGEANRGTTQRGLAKGTETQGKARNALAVSSSESSRNLQPVSTRRVRFWADKVRVFLPDADGMCARSVLIRVHADDVILSDLLEAVCVKEKVRLDPAKHMFRRYVTGIFSAASSTTDNTVGEPLDMELSLEALGHTLIGDDGRFQEPCLVVAAMEAVDPTVAYSPYPGMPQPSLRHLGLGHTTRHGNVPRCTKPHRTHSTAPRHTVPPRTAPHRTAPHRTASTAPHSVRYTTFSTCISPFHTI